MKPIRFFIAMGVSGSGKSSVGKALAESLGWMFYYAEDFHPPANVAKMAKGIPLDDTDRSPWLVALHDLISSSLQQNKSGVLACSALKERYRQQLMGGNEGVQLVYLKGSYALIWSRMIARKEHYMKLHMLQGQFEELEESTKALTIDISMPVKKYCQKY